MKEGSSVGTELRSPEGSVPQPPDRVPAESVQEELERILASPAFIQSQRLSRFLRFTVDQFIQGEGEKLKEYHVGTAVFDKDDSFDPRTDPIVRVEAGRLRSKLKEYYAAEGRDDQILIDLPKGSYVPVVQKRISPSLAAAEVPVIRRPIQWGNVAVIAFLFLAALAAFWAFAEFRQNQILRSRLEAAKPHLTNPEFALIWESFLSPEARNFAILGSPTFFASPQYNLFVRPYVINDASTLLGNPQLRALQERLGPLAGPRYDYALLRDALALQRLTAFLVGNGGSLTAVPAHEAAWDSIQDGNIIFLGAPRMNPLMQQLPFQQDFEWDSDYNICNRKPQAGEEKLYTTPSHEETLSYAVIASFPGMRPNREILLLMAQGGSGTQAAVDYVTRPETVRNMTERLKLNKTGEHKHFQMLLRVIVHHGTPIKAEYITHHMIP